MVAKKLTLDAVLPGPGDDQGLSTDVIANALAGGVTAGRARPVDIGVPAAQTAAPAKAKKTIKQSVGLEEDVWRSLRNYCLDNHISGQKVIAKLVTNFLAQNA